MPRLTGVSAVTFLVAIAAAALAFETDQKSPNPDENSARKGPGSSPVEKKSHKNKEGKSAEAKKLAERNRWMLFKLTSSQAMFTELTRGNLEGVGRHARASMVVDQLEYWLRGKEFRQRSEYHKQLNQYQFAVRELARHADDGNIDGALESWLDISRSCVQCHQLLRDDVKVDMEESEEETAP